MYLSVAVRKDFVAVMVQNSKHSNTAQANHKVFRQAISTLLDIPEYSAKGASRSGFLLAVGIFLQGNEKNLV